MYYKLLVTDHQFASRMNMHRNGNGYTLDGFYFLPKPQQLVYTHCPDEPQWQLLERPLTLAEFEALPVVRSAFFKYGLDFLTNRARLTVSDLLYSILVRVYVPV